jgi:hypothetical protein
MKLRMYQIDVEINDNNEILISQDKHEGGQASSILISADQVDFLHSLLEKAKEEIERRGAGQTDQEEDETRGRSAFETRRR